jgi:hypothetical protein
MVPVKRACTPEKKDENRKVWQNTRTCVSSNRSHRHYRFCHLCSELFSCDRVTADYYCRNCVILRSVLCLQKCFHFQLVLWHPQCKRSQSCTETCVISSVTIDRSPFCRACCCFLVFVVTLHSSESQQV